MTTQTNNNSVPSAQNGEITLVMDNSIPPLPHYEPIPQRHGLLSMSNQDREIIKWYAGMLARSSFNNSRTPLSEGDYCIIMTKGYALGYSPENAPDVISIIQGKPVITAAGMLGLILKAKMSGEIEALKIDTQEDYCTVTIKRRGLEPHSETFSMADARRMKTTSWENGQKRTISLAEKDNYIQQPRVMLKWRAVAACARAYCPDIIGGLYTVEEMAGDRDVVVTEDGQMYLAEPKPTPKIEQKPPMQLNQPNGNGNHAKPSTTATTFSNGEKPTAPVEVDPLSITPTPPPTSSEPDPNDPEDIRHAIPVYGADHWYIANYKAFVKSLRKFIPEQDSMLDNEVSSAGLRLMSVPTWKAYASGKDALIAVEAKFNTNKKPATTPTPAPVPVVVVPAPQPVTTTSPTTYPTTYPIGWYDEFEDFIWTHFDMSKFAEWEAKAGKKLTSYASLEAIKEDARLIAMRDGWDILVTEAKYINAGGRNAAYIELNGLFPVRMYGRSTTFKKQVGDSYYAQYGVEGWANGGEYSIGLLRVSWKRNDAGTAIAHTVQVVDEADADITPEELGITAEELKAMSEVNI